MKPSQNPGSRIASRATVATAPAPNPTATRRARGSLLRRRSPQMNPTTAIEGRSATFANMFIEPRPDSAVGKMMGEIDAAARRMKIVITRFMKVLQRGGTDRSSLPRRFALLGDHVGEHVKLLVEHACCLIDACVVERLENHRWLVVAHVGLVVRTLIDVNAQRQEEARSRNPFKDLLSDIGIAHDEHGSLHFKPRPPHPLPPPHAAHPHHS